MSALNEAAAHSRLLESSNLVGVCDRKLEEAISELDSAGRGDVARRLEKVRELHRLCGTRLASVLREVGAGRAE